MARVRNLMDGEGRLLVLLAAMMLVNSLAMQISYVASVSGFLEADGLDLIWIVWTLSYLAFLAITALQSLIIDRFDRVGLVRFLLIAFASAFLAIWAALTFGTFDGVAYAALYIVAELQWMVFPAFYWVLANDVTSMAQAKRLFPRVASAGFVGSLIGLLLASLAPALFSRLGVGLEHVLLANVVLYLAIIAVPGRLRPNSANEEGRRPRTARATGFQKALTGGMEFVRNVPAFRLLTLSLLALMVVDTILEFHFLAVTDAAFPGQATYQSFFGSYRMVRVLLGLAIQSLLVKWMLDRFELQRVLTLTPFVAIGTVTLALVVPGLVGGVGALLVLRLAAETFHDSAKKAMQNLVPEEWRGRVSLILESVVISVGTIAGALLIGALTLASGNGTRFTIAWVYLPIAAVFAVLAATAALRMVARFDESLLNWRLKRRARSGASVLDQLL